MSYEAKGYPALVESHKRRQRRERKLMRLRFECVSDDDKRRNMERAAWWAQEGRK